MRGMAYRYTSDLDLIKISKENEGITEEKTLYVADKYDYLVSVGAGGIGGLIDIFLVGAPTTKKENRSVLTEWSDEQTDNFIKKTARKLGWNPREGNENNVKSAIGFLEKNYRVNYDQRHKGDVEDLFNMSTKDHHLKSLGHSPDFIGLFFSILNQFTHTATFVSDGQIITINSKTRELEGSNVISKLFSGFINWFVHLVSDVGGSSGASQRGSGIAMPFYSLTQLLNFGKFDVGKDKQTIAEIANRAFREGYDFRHGIATAIPVLLTEIIIRFFWSLRAVLQYDYRLKDALPRLHNNRSLRRMLIAGHGTLSLLDGFDAGIKSGGDALLFVNNLNLIAWFRLSMLVMREVTIQFGLNLTSYDEINEIYIEVHEEISTQLALFKQSNIQAYEYELKEYNKTLKMLEKELPAEELKQELHGFYSSLDIELPWDETVKDFDDFMNNDGLLHFKKRG